MDPLRTVVAADIVVDTDGRIAALAEPGGDTHLAFRRSTPPG